ncbi:MAG: hypothetical protein LAP38_00070 [Acidobacteriia bacterium]|nr:hypothetical protein [Terriglobia bacterium]
MDLPKDLREFLESLNSNEVEYVIVGGYAQAYHGRPRFTGDIDVLVRPSRDNAARLRIALTQFGFGQLGLSEDDFVAEGRVIQLGIAPNRIDLLTSLTGCTFDDVWQTRISTQIAGVPVNMIAKKQYVQNKRAVGRPQDLADIDGLI